MPMPEIDKESRKRPLCYDPKRKQFIHFPEIVSGEAEIVPVDDLSDDDLKVLVIRRWEVLPEDTTVQAISGPPMRRDDVIAAIEKDILSSLLRHVDIPALISSTLLTLAGAQS